MRKRVFYKVCALAAAGCLAMSASGCGQEGTEAVDTLAGEEPASAEAVAGAAAVSGQEAGTAGSIVNAEDMFTDRDLSGEYDEAGCQEIQLGSGTVTIAEEGVYILSGTLEDGMVIVDADDTAKVQLVLDGAVISNREGAAIYVKEADKVFITLAEGSVNVLANGGGYTSIDNNNIDAVIFSKSDLVINGAGSLSITAEAGHGIVSKDDLKVTGGTVTVTAASHGISGKDSVRIAGGTLNITSGKDGIHSENDDEEDKGFVYIADGNVTVVSDGDCISADAYLQIEGGVFNLTGGKGSANKTVATDENGDAVSTKGIKAAGQLVVNGGTYQIDSQDDALHTNSSLTVNGGSFLISTGDDALHADETVTVADGSIDISYCYEGIEGQNVIISGGDIRLYATDDGLNAAGGRDASGFGGMFGGGPSEMSSDSSILISGGQIYINAAGDGVDSNGSLTVTGGELYVSGPESGADGAIDYEGEGQITGGIVVAVGSSGMAMNFGETSTQGSILINTVQCHAGTEVLLRDAEGKTLVSYTSEKSFNSVVVSCPGLVQGGTYTLSVGDEDREITMDSLIYGSGTGGFGGRGGFGGHGGFDGQDGFGGRFQDGEIPEMPADGEKPQGGGRREMPQGGEAPEMPADGEIPQNG